jgi:hypothetical protein
MALQISVNSAEKRIAKIVGGKEDAKDLIRRIMEHKGDHLAQKISEEMRLFVPPSRSFQMALETATLGLYKSPETKVFNILWALKNNPLVEKPMGWHEASSTYLL